MNELHEWSSKQMNEERQQGPGAELSQGKTQKPKMLIAPVYFSSLTTPSCPFKTALLPPTHSHLDLGTAFREALHLVPACVTQPWDLRHPAPRAPTPCSPALPPHDRLHYLADATFGEESEVSYPSGIPPR